MPLPIRRTGSAALCFVLVALCQDAVIASEPLRKEAAVLEEIVVYSRLESESQMDVPQTISVLDAELIEQTNAKSIGDVLRFVPGVSRDGSTLDAFGDNYLVRGFRANQTVNGIGVAQLNAARDAVNVDRIEVLKGPASVLYGQLQPGAVINVVTKQPGEAWSTKAVLEAGNYDFYRATTDITRPLSEKIGLRLNAAYEDSDAFIDDYNKEHVFVSPVLAVRFGEATKLTLESAYSRNEWNAFYNGVPAEGTVLANPNGQFSRGRNYTDPAFNGIVRSSGEISVRLEHRFSNALAWRGAASYTGNRNRGQELFGLLGFEDDSKRLLVRALQDGRSRDMTYSFYNDVSLSATLGRTTHNIIAGFDYSHRKLRADRLIALVPSLDIFDPVFVRTLEPESVLPLDDLSDASRRSSDAYGLFMQDRISVSEKLAFIGGVRYSKFDESNRRTTVAGMASLFEQSPSSTTTQLGVVYTPAPQVSLFANRSTSFVPTDGATVNGESLDPETGTQYEIGMKIAGGAAALTAAVFELTRGEVSVGDVENPTFQLSIGEQRARGAELSVSGTLFDNWKMAASYAYTDSETKRDTDALLMGKKVRNVPSNTFALNTLYEMSAGTLSGLSIGGSLTYVDSRAGDNENSFFLPSYTRFDIYASYRPSERVGLHLNVENATDEEIYTHAFSLFEVFPDAPRSYRLRVTMEF